MNSTAEKEILGTDRSFSRMSTEQGVSAAFSAYADENAVKLQNNSEPVKGLDAIKQSMEGSKGTLRWEPFFVYAADSGDLGYTIGDWDLTVDSPPEAKHRLSGNYITIWKKQVDGKWKWVFDSGTQKNTI